MRNTPFLFALLLLAPAATAQTILFDVPGPGGSRLFHLNSDASLVSQGVFGDGSIPVEGAGVRLMWYPAKGAFRVGGIDDRQWHDINVGDYSVAMGWNTRANGDYAVAMGFNSSASGTYGTAMGYETTASGSASTAMGTGTAASSLVATAMGFYTTASGERSTAMGSSTTAGGDYATAMGLSTTASGERSTAMGSSTTAQAYSSLVLGRYNIIAGDPGLWVFSDPLLVVGNGTSTNPSNAFTLLKNGNLTIAGTLTENSDRRLKEAITPLYDVRAGLGQLQPVRYRFRAGTNRPDGEHLGLIAQEVEAVFPELVSRDADGYLSVSYTHLTAVLVQALNEQQAEVESLKARLARLEAAETGSTQR